MPTFGFPHGALPRATATLTIPAGQSASDALDTADMIPLGVITPGAWTEAALSFQVSADGSTWIPLYDQYGSEVSIPSSAIPTGAARAFSIALANVAAWRFIRLVSGTNATPVSPAASRSIVLLGVRA